MTVATGHPYTPTPAAFAEPAPALAGSTIADELPTVPADPRPRLSGLRTTGSRLVTLELGEPMNVRDIPDPTAFGFKAPKWAAAHTEHARLQRQLLATQAEQGALRRQLGQAQDADSAAYADAIRAGRGDPGTPQVDAVKSELESVLRKADALKLAVEQAYAELVAAVEQEKDTVQAAAEAAVTTRRATLQAAVEGWTESRTELAEAVALREYVRTFPDTRFKTAGGYMRNAVRGGDGRGPMPSAEVLAMLRQDAAEPLETVRPDNVQPLQPTVREIGVSPVANLER